MLRHYFGRLQTKLLQWRIEPFDENALNVIAIAFDCELAATLPDQVRVPVSFPGLSKRDPSRKGSRFTFGGCSFTGSRAPLFGFRMLSSADLS
jgi:hypothetical protein